MVYDDKVIDRTTTLVGIIVGATTGLILLWFLVCYIIDNTVNKYIGDLYLMLLMVISIGSGVLTAELLKRWMKRQN